MANIGLKYLVCGELTEEELPNASVEYSDGRVLSRAITVNLSVEINDVSLYADDKVAENIKEFKSGKFTANGDYFSPEDLGWLLGHKVEKTDDGTIITAKGDDDGKNVGVGFYSTVVRKGEKKYRAIWLHKAKFSIPGVSLATKGESITFQTPTIEATVMIDALGVWKDDGEFATEEAAREWLNDKAKITPVP